MSVSMLRKLVRNFPENGPKLLCENPANVRDLLKIVGEPAVDLIDFPRMTVERTHFVKPDFAHVAADVLLQAPFQGKDVEEAIYVYVLIEHQSTPQRFFHLRLAEYVLECYKMQKRAWDKQHDSDTDLLLHPVIPVVFYTGERSWKKVETLCDVVHEGERFAELIPRFRPHFLNLRDTSEQSLERDGGFFGQVLRLIQQRNVDVVAFQSLIRDVLGHLEKMPTKEKSRWVEFLSYVLAGCS